MKDPKKPEMLKPKHYLLLRGGDSLKRRNDWEEGSRGVSGWASGRVDRMRR